jgi:small-conductance mechanosensitive channel
MELLIEHWRLIAWLVGVPVVLGLISRFLIYRIVRKIAQHTGSGLDDSIIRNCYKPALWIIVVLVIRMALAAAVTEKKIPDSISHVLSLFLIGFVSWLLIKIVAVLQEYAVGRFQMDVKDNLRARKIHTQLRVLRRIVTITIGVVALATMLMTFPKVRQLGTTILASAGIIGIVVGMAAQRTIGAFIAGLQIAFSQPIRVDDVVIVENEWGRIEEITLTYVVVKIWDLRRLIVPITYFIEKPFQNWTRVTADILGTVFLYMDYTVPVDAIREEFQRLLKESELWDGKVCGVQVTNTSERTMEVRALMSAADASIAWNLRCHVREKLIDFIKTKYPHALPRFRAELEQVKSDQEQVHS